jgi:hypothetical protein
LFFSFFVTFLRFSFLATKRKMNGYRVALVALVASAIIGIVLLVMHFSKNRAIEKTTRVTETQDTKGPCVRLTGCPDNNLIYSVGPFHDNIYPGYRGINFEDTLSVTNDELAGQIVKSAQACISLGQSLAGCQAVNYEVETGRCTPILNSKNQLAPNDQWHQGLNLEQREIGGVPVVRHQFFAWDLLNNH